MGYLTVQTLPSSTIFVNGLRTTSNPLYRFEVPPGEVRLSFRVTDGDWWAEDRVVTVRPGEDLNLGQIRLSRQP